MLDEVAFDLLLPNPVHLFLVLGHQGSGDGLCDSINLGQMTSTLHTGRDGQAIRLLTAFADLQDREGGPGHFPGGRCLTAGAVFCRGPLPAGNRSAGLGASSSL